MVNNVKKGIQIYTAIAFNTRATFWFLTLLHTTLCVCLLHFMCVRLHNGYTRAYVQIMQHANTHKAMTWSIEAKSYSLVESNHNLVESV